jgi:hypothetical protein
MKKLPNMKKVKKPKKQVKPRKIKIPKRVIFKQRKAQKAKYWPSIKAGIVFILVVFMIGYAANHQTRTYVSPSIAYRTDTPKPTEVPTSKPEEVQKGIQKLRQLENVVPKKEDATIEASISVEATSIPTPSPTPNPTSTPEPELAKVPEPEDKVSLKRGDIEGYIKTIFRAQGRIAIAISNAECNPGNARYPKCHLKSNVEHSVGIFQINLYNAKHWVHAARIPGNTMEEKIKWLENPYNNTLYAYWLYTTSGWNPWSVFTNGRYQAFLDKK